VRYYADQYAVPMYLVEAIIEAESGWQPNAVSSKGAAGLMQLMPATAVTFGVTNRFEVEQNIRAGVAYLAHLLTVFRGDVRLVAAAYISGERRIAAAGLRYSNAAVFGSGASVYVAGDDEEMQWFVPIEDLFRGRHFDRQITFYA
jgi:soluble lytic murein transglycosylase-like protein